MDEQERGVIIQGLDVIDVVKFIESKNKKFQAILLNDLEQIIDKNKEPEKFSLARKLFLDGFNNYTRSVLRLIFGEVEHLIEK